MSSGDVSTLRVGGRIEHDRLFLTIAQQVAERGTCLRARVGAVVARNRRAVSIGYAGSAPGQPHCNQVGCLASIEGGCIRTIHAEVNAILFMAKEGISTSGCTLYITHSPCLNCAKIILCSGIKEVVYLFPYRLTEGIDFLLENDVRVRKLEL